MVIEPLAPRVVAEGFDLLELFDADRLEAVGSVDMRRTSGRLMDWAGRRGSRRRRA